MTTLMNRFAWRLLTLLCLVMAAPLAQALTLGISVNPDRVRPNEGLRVAVTVTNDSAVAVSGLSLQVQMPAAGVNATAPVYISGGATCSGNCDPGEFITWNLGLLAPGQGVTVLAAASVNGGAVSGSTITFPAKLFVNATQTLTASKSVVVDADNALSLAVDANKDGVAPGDRLTYTVSYGNRSTASVTGTTLELPLPPGVTLVSTTGGGAMSGNTVVWTLNTLQAGQSGRQQVVVMAGGGLQSGTLLPISAAQIEGTSAVTGAELASASLVTRVQTNPVLGLSIAMNPDPARPNEGMRTALTVTNRSSTTVFGAVLNVRMPSEGLNATAPVYLSGGSTCVGNCDAYEFITWNLGTLAPNASVTLLMVNSVNGNMDSGRLIELESELRADGVPMTVGRHTVAVDADNALSLAVDADKDGVAPAELLTYSLTYGNRSTASVTGTTLSLPLPSGVSFVSATGGGVLSGNAVTWALNTLQAGQSGRQQVVVTVGGSAASGTLLPIDAARIEGTSAVTGTEQARATLTTRVQANPVLGLSIAMNPDPARPNEGMRTALTVTNRSSTTVFGAVLNVRMPSEGLNATAPVYLSGGSTCVGNCDAYEFITWNLGTLAPNASVTLLMVNSVNGNMDSGRLIELESELRADGVPMTVGRHTVAVDADNALSLAVQTDKDSIAPGEQLLYTLTYANRSTGTINGSVLSFVLPEGAVPVSASSGATVSGRTVSWNLAGLLAGAGGQRTVRISVPAVPPAGLRLRVNAATLSGTSAVTGPESARASLTTRIVAGNPLRLALVSLIPNPVEPSETLTATYRVTNTSAVPLNTVTLNARVPTNGVNSFVSSAVSGGATCVGNCDPYEFVTWNLGTLAAGASTTLTMPMVVNSGADFGLLIGLDAEVRDDNGDQSLASGNVVVGTAFSAPPPEVPFPGTDTDGDGIADSADNCTAVANPDQRDTDDDGYGNACDADFDNNGAVSFSDLALFKTSFGTTNLLYDLDGNGSVNFADLALFKTLFGKPPGPSGKR